MAHAAARDMRPQLTSLDANNDGDWRQGLPGDVLVACLERLLHDPQAVASARGACAAWRAAADACVQEVTLR
jgi:hypothetical protein